jgi:hypothetical protein
MFFRGRQPETSIWRRFRTSADGFSFVQEADYYTAHVVANAERVADLFHALLEHLPPAVDVAMEDFRSNRKWKGENLPLTDVRDAIARLKVLVAAHGGVEMAIYTSEDQVTLNPMLELFIYSRTDQWKYILSGKGLDQQRAVRTRSWKLKRHEYPEAPELVKAFASAAGTLGLAEA